jgi:hypothetical protein
MPEQDRLKRVPQGGGLNDKEDAGMGSGTHPYGLAEVLIV